MIKRALIIDTETTGLDPQKDKVIEVACILYDLEFAAPIASFASLIQADSNEAAGTNHIPPKLLKDAPAAPEVWGTVDRDFFQRADVVLAHNASFDRAFVPKFRSQLLGKPWVCTMNHVEWPQPCSSKSLAAIALTHGVGIVQAHRALADCDIIARLLTRVYEMGTGPSFDLQRIIANAMRPRVKVVARVLYEQRDLAKQAGFTWDTEHKIWWREDFVDNVEKYPFKCRRLKGGDET